MPNIVNLNKARKAKARLDGQAIAAENRLKFGRTKVEKQNDKQAVTRLTRKLDQARRGDDSK